MADNQKTYKATIDVDTKSASKNMDLLEKTVSTSLGEFDNLNEAISKTQDTLGKLDPNSKAFKELSGELQNLKDDLLDTEIQSSRFTEALAEQPGVMGLVGQSLEGLRGTMKVFMANPIIAVVSLIAGAFLTMRESLTKTTEGQETLNRISAAFGKIMGPVFALIETIALPIFNALATVIEKAANAFNRAARFFGVSQEKIVEASRNSSEVLQESYEEEKERQEELTEIQEQESQKRIDAAKKEADRKLEIQKAASELLRQIELDLMDEKSRELLLREEKYQQDLKLLKQAGITDFTNLDKQYYRDLKEIRERFDENETVDIIQVEDARKRLQLGIKAETAKEGLKIEIETAKKSKEIAEIDAETKLLIVSNTLGQLAEAVGENTVAGKALAVAQATINTYQGASLALATYPPPFGAIAAGTVIAAGLLNVKKIISTKVPAPPGTNLQGSSGGGGAASSPPPTPPSLSFDAPEVQAGGAGQGNPSNQIAETIAASREQPIKAFVVSEDISSQQAMDRRVNTAASFG